MQISVSGGFCSFLSCCCNETGQTNSGQINYEQTTNLQERPVAPPPPTHDSDHFREFVEPRDNDPDWWRNLGGGPRQPNQPGRVDASDDSSEIYAGSSDSGLVLGFNLEDPPDVEDPSDLETIDIDNDLEDTSDLKTANSSFLDFLFRCCNAPEGDDQNIDINQVTPEFVNNQTERALKIVHNFCKSATDSCEGLDQEDLDKVCDIISNAIAYIIDSDTITFDD